MPEGTQRKLAAIVSADVVGYSRLMQADEAGTHARLKARFTEIVRPKIEAQGGRVVKLMGDGLLAEFPSVVGAAEWAVEVQCAVARANVSEPPDTRIEYRVGINLGDVIIDGDDLYGDGVNLAARLQEIADTGGICLSDAAHQQVLGKVTAEFIDGGEVSLKNITGQVRVWRWTSDGSRASETATARSERAPLPDKPSIAVLPFDNMSGDPEQEYFADGLADDIISALSRYRWLLVIARNSSFAFKDQSRTAKEIAKELGVGYVLEGSVRRAGNRVRVAAQLIDAASDNYLWAERYEGALDDVFALQDDITRRVTASLKPELERAEWQRLKTYRRTDINAWNLYLRGIWHLYKYTREGNREALTLLRQAIAVDAEFSQAHAAAAYVLFHNMTDGYAGNRDETLKETLALAEKAVAIDDQDAFAHFVLGRVCSINMEYERAISELETAIELNPSLAEAYHGLGFTLTYSGRAEEAIPKFETAYRLSPHDANVWAFFGIRACAYIDIRQYDKAIEAAREAVRKPHAKFWAFAHLASALGHGGTADEASNAAVELLSRKPEFSISFAREHRRWHRQGEHFLEGLRKAGLPE